MSRVTRAYYDVSCAIYGIGPTTIDLSQDDAYAILYLNGNVMLTSTNRLFFIGSYVYSILTGARSGATSTSNVGRIVRQANVRYVLSVRGFQVRRSVSLLQKAGNLWIFRALPILWVFYTSGSYYYGNYERVIRTNVFTLEARCSMGMSILVLYRSRVVSIYLLQACVVRGSQMVPRARVVGSIVALYRTRRKLSIVSLGANGRVVLSIWVGYSKVRSYVSSGAFRGR